MKLIYITNARIPTEKAHGYQICKMCKEFSLPHSVFKKSYRNKENISISTKRGRFQIKYPELAKSNQKTLPYVGWRAVRDDL